MEKAYVYKVRSVCLDDEEFEKKESYVEDKISEIDFEEINKLGREWATSIIEDEYFAKPGHRNDSGVDFVCAIQMASYPDVYDEDVEEKFLELWKEKKQPDNWDFNAMWDVVERCRDYAESWGFRPYFDLNSIEKVRKEDRNGDTLYWSQAHSYRSSSNYTKVIMVPNPQGLYDVCKGNIGRYPDSQDIDMAYFDHGLGMIDLDTAKEALRNIEQENSED